MFGNPGQAKNFALLLTYRERPSGRNRKNSRAARPFLEWLEDRCTPSVAFVENDLVSNVSGRAKFFDKDLVNPWGMSYSPSGVFWISDNGTGKSTLYDGTGQSIGLVVGIPPPSNSPSGTIGTPTGTAFNGQVGAFGSNSFLFCSEDGTISAWSSGDATVEVDNSSKPTAAAGAVYKGLDIATDSNNRTLLYTANFRSGAIDVFDSSFKATTVSGGFTDPDIPAGYAPFNIQNLGGKLYVTYALQDDAKHDDVAGAGNGYVDVFNNDGVLQKHLVAQGPLNSPWGLALAPANYGQFSNALLVGNFGDGHINAFDPATGTSLGEFKDVHNQPIAIDGLWGLKFGNGAGAGSDHALYFTAGINSEQDGLLGSLTQTEVKTAPQITSANQATFTVGTAGSFHVTVTGSPAPKLSASGTLPRGVSFNPSSGLLSGKPAAGSAGSFKLTITASNGVAPNAVQTLTLVVNQVSAITSAVKATFTTSALYTKLLPNVFTVTATGSPKPTISESGALPNGVTFDKGVLKGTPAPGTGGVYQISFTASNGVGTDAKQNFTLTVFQPPAIGPADTGATFTVGSAGSFPFSTTGFPEPKLTEAGKLPAGVTFANGNLAGTPASGTGGIYNLVITAANSAVTSNLKNIVGTASKAFKLTVAQAPAITSVNKAAFTVGRPAFPVKVATTGFPVPTIKETGALPKGIKFVNGELSGTPAAGTGGVYPITFTASNGVGTEPTQNFTLTVNQAPAITSAASVTFMLGTPGTFTVAAMGFPLPTFSEVGKLPAGVTFVNGVLSGTPAANTTGKYKIVLKATNGVGGVATQSFTLTVGAEMHTAHNRTASADSWMELVALALASDKKSSP